MFGAITPDRLRVRRTYHTSKKRRETSALPSAASCNADRKIQFPYLCVIAFSNSENFSNRANLTFQACGMACSQSRIIGILAHALAWSLSAFDPSVNLRFLDRADFFRPFFLHQSVSLRAVAPWT